MPLDPKARMMLEGMKQMQMPSLNSMPIEEGRKAMNAMMIKMSKDPKPIGAVMNRMILGPGGDLPLRIYSPEGSGDLPVLMFFHGGGFSMGNLDSHDALCRDLCAGAGSVVVSVDYRLAPENKFPAGTEDCLAATRWVGAHAREIGGKPEMIAVAGDSAGGNLSAVTALRIRDEGGPRLAGQVLHYPTCIFSHFDLPSHKENGNGDYMLSLKDMTELEKVYLNDSSDAANPYAAPLQASHFDGLPPALIITAEYDPLRDEGELYAQRLREAGVPTRLIRYDGMLHGFITMTSMFDQAGEALNETYTWLWDIFREP